MEELVEKLDNRNAALDKARARIAELEAELVQAESDAGDREQRMAAELEVERVRIAEREQTFREGIAAREREVERRIELLEGREGELRYSDGLLLQREHSRRCPRSRARNPRPGAGGALGRASEGARSRARRARAADRGRGAEDRGGEAQVREPRDPRDRARAALTSARSIRRRARSRAARGPQTSSTSSRPTWREREEIVDRRKREFDAYVRRVQGSFYSDR